MSTAYKNIPSSTSNEGAWKTWYQALENSDMSRDEAQILFYEAWGAFGSGGSADTQSLRNYFLTQKKIDITQTGDGFFRAADSVFTGLKYGFSYIGFMLFLVIVVLTVLFLRLLWGLVKDPIKTLKATGEAARDVKTVKLQLTK